MHDYVSDTRVFTSLVISIFRDAGCKICSH